MRAITLVLLLLLGLNGFSQQEAKTFESTYTVSAEMDYLLYVPASYKENANKEYPLMMFLHGAGERGDEINLVKVHGPPKLAEKDNWEFIVISPQCKSSDYWNSEGNLQMLSRLITMVEENYRVDESRIYLTGLSMGGYGSWALAAKEPDRFAAVAPICGGGDPSMAEKYKNTPVWVFHGAKDSVVPIVRSEEMVDAIKEYNPDIKFTIYLEAGHDSWTETYNNEELYSWFLSNSLK